MGERGGSGVSAREGCRGAAKGLMEGSLAVLACSQAPHGSWSWICAAGLGGAPCRLWKPRHISCPLRPPFSEGRVLLGTTVC